VLNDAARSATRVGRRVGPFRVQRAQVVGVQLDLAVHHGSGFQVDAEGARVLPLQAGPHVPLPIAEGELVEPLRPEGDTVPDRQLVAAPRLQRILVAGAVAAREQLQRRPQLIGDAQPQPAIADRELRRRAPAQRHHRIHARASLDDVGRDGSAECQAEAIAVAVAEPGAEGGREAVGERVPFELGASGEPPRQRPHLALFEEPEVVRVQAHRGIQRQAGAVEHELVALEPSETRPAAEVVVAGAEDPVHPQDEQVHHRQIAAHADLGLVEVHTAFAQPRIRQPEGAELEPHPVVDGPRKGRRLDVRRLLVIAFAGGMASAARSGEGSHRRAPGARIGVGGRRLAPSTRIGDGRPRVGSRRSQHQQPHQRNHGELRASGATRSGHSDDPPRAPQRNASVSRWSALRTGHHRRDGAGRTAATGP
jgi:hypothetical protein